MKDILKQVAGIWGYHPYLLDEDLRLRDLQAQGHSVGRSDPGLDY